MVEGVKRLAEFEHHVVRDVDDKPERTHSAEFKALLHHLRGRPVLNRRNHASRIARTLRRILDDDLHFRFDGSFALGEVHRRASDFPPENRTELAGESNHAERVRAIPRHLDVEHRLRLLRANRVTHKRPRRDVRRELDDAVVPALETELPERAAHAERLDAAQLALLDLEAAVGNHRADLRERRLDALAAVRCAADDLILVRSIRHLADVKMVGIGVHLAFGDLDDDKIVRKRRTADCLDGLDLKTRAGQFLGEFLRFDVIDLDVFIQPTERKLHLLYSLLS